MALVPSRRTIACNWIFIRPIRNQNNNNQQMYKHDIEEYSNWIGTEQIAIMHEYEYIWILLENKWWNVLDMALWVCMMNLWPGHFWPISIAMANTGYAEEVNDITMDNGLLVYAENTDHMPQKQQQSNK